MRTEERKAIKACVFQTEKIQIKKMFWSWNEDSLKGRIKKKKKPQNPVKQIMVNLTK